MDGEVFRLVSQAEWGGRRDMLWVVGRVVVVVGGGWWAAINLNLASVAGSRWIIVTFQDLILDRYEPEKRS